MQKAHVTAALHLDGAEAQAGAGVVGRGDEAQRAQREAQVRGKAQHARRALEGRRSCRRRLLWRGRLAAVLVRPVAQRLYRHAAHSSSKESHSHWACGPSMYCAYHLW